MCSLSHHPRFPPHSARPSVLSSRYLAILASVLFKVVKLPVPEPKMGRYSTKLGSVHYSFSNLKQVMAKASPLRSGDCLANVAASTAKERVAAQTVLAEVPLTRFLEEELIDYETDEVTRL